MITFDATYDLITPAFLGGADRAKAELRVPSFKGALRFWWRALQGQHLHDAGKLRKREAQLFGSAEAGQSRVSMRLLVPASPPCAGKGELVEKMLPRASGRPSPARGHGLRYLGYGVINASNGELTRSCVRSPCTVRVRLVWRPLSEERDDDTLQHTAAEARDEIAQALVALGTLGGVGARSRRGFGSMALRELVVTGAAIPAPWRAPETAEKLRENIESLYAGHGRAALPEWTALSRRARHVLLVPQQSEATDELTLLDRLGCELVRFRSFGRNGRILDGSEKAARLFESDHDLYKTVTVRRGRADRHPQRVVFGLPHNYSRDFGVTPAVRELDRRASPLLLHVHRCGATPVLVLSFLPARFLPQGQDRLRVGTRHEGAQVRLAEGDAFWRPIHDFLDRLQERRHALGVAQVLEVRHDR